MKDHKGVALKAILLLVKFYLLFSMISAFLIKGFLDYSRLSLLSWVHISILASGSIGLITYHIKSSHSRFGIYLVSCLMLSNSYGKYSVLMSYYAQTDVVDVTISVVSIPLMLYGLMYYHILVNKTNA